MATLEPWEARALWVELEPFKPVVLNSEPVPWEVEEVSPTAWHLVLEVFSAHQLRPVQVHLSEAQTLARIAPSSEEA